MVWYDRCLVLLYAASKNAYGAAIRLRVILGYIKEVLRDLEFACETTSEHDPKMEASGGCGHSKTEGERTRYHVRLLTDYLRGWYLHLPC